VTTEDDEAALADLRRVGIDSVLDLNNWPRDPTFERYLALYDQAVCLVGEVERCAALGYPRDSDAIVLAEQTLDLILGVLEGRLPPPKPFDHVTADG
jgi:hypothetical protein